jgi:hypothetical protein
MTAHGDVGNVGIYGSAVGGLAAGTAGWADVINGNALIIGICLTVASLVVGAVLKGVAIWLELRQNDRHHSEEMAAQKEQSAQLAEAMRAEIRESRG